MASPYEAPDPSILLVWDPMEVARLQELDRLDGWWIAGTVKGTQPGQRAVVYRTKRDQGIAAVFDFATRAFPHDDFGWAAFGRPLPLNSEEVGRQRLLESPVAEVFRRPQGRRTLGPSDARKVAVLLGRAPRWQGINEDLPDLESEDWTWIPSRGDVRWAVEGAMRDALMNDRRSWRKLGFKRQPVKEKSPPGSRLRMDLFQPGVVGECKLVAGLSTLRQLDGYLDPQRRKSPNAWRGHIIVAQGYSDTLAKAVFDREDIQLWVCRSDSQDRPKLIEITKRRLMP